jgi:hypothetical protein
MNNMNNENLKLHEKIVFHDKENNLQEVEIKLNEKGHFRMTGHSPDSLGQCQDSINPANKEQKRLVEIWNKWHLNDMKAGTDKQEEALKGLKVKKGEQHYDAAVVFLKKKHLYMDNGYRYGSSWKTKMLPKDLPEEIRSICAVIRAQEAARKESLTDGEWSEDTADEIKALAKNLGLTPKEAENDISEEDSHHFKYCGIFYLVAEDDIVEEMCKESLDEYMWRDAVQAERTTSGYDDWVEEVIRNDGYGSILNSWNGDEATEEIDGTTYYIIRH